MLHKIVQLQLCQNILCCTASIGEQNERNKYEQNTADQHNITAMGQTSTKYMKITQNSAHVGHTKRCALDSILDAAQQKTKYSKNTRKQWKKQFIEEWGRNMLHPQTTNYFIQQEQGSHGRHPAANTAQLLF